MSSFELSSLLTAILSLLLAIFLFFRGRYILNRVWAFASFSTFIWSLGLYGVTTSQTERIAFFWQIVLDIGGIMVPVFYSLFVVTLVDEKKKYAKYTTFLYYLASFFLVLSFTPLFKQGVGPLLNFNYWIIPGPLYFLFPLYLLCVSGFATTILIRNYNKYSGIKKQQIKYVLFAGLAGFGGGSTNFFPQLSSIVPALAQIYPVGNYFVVLYIIAITYAIAKYRLMNIRFIIARSFLYFLLVSVVSSVFAFTSFFTADIFQISNPYWKVGIYMVVSFVLVFFLDPLRKLLAKITDDIFFKDKIDYQAVLRDMSIIIAKEIDLETLLGALRTSMMAALKLKAADILVKKNEHFKSLTVAGGKEFEHDGPLIDYLGAHRDIIITDEFYRETFDMPEGGERLRKQRVLDELERQGVEFCMPVYLEGDLKAVMILGQKQSGDVYGTEEVNFFSSLAPQIAVAIEKSQLYEEIGEFNLRLQEKVNRATQRLKMTNLELQEANAHLKQLDTAKSEFLSIASHQLRTPISAVKGYLSMLLEGDFGKLVPKQRKVISDLFESSARLARLINIFLNVSRIESGRFKLERREVDVDELVDSVIKELAAQAKNKKLEVSFARLKQPRPVYIDADKIREVILNLVDNAIKYTPKGRIDIETNVADGQFHFIIRDTGLGIRQSEVKALFRKFVRGTGIAQVNTQGSGLGLYIAQRVVSEHGGKIWAESQGLEKGSTFHFYIPIIKASDVATIENMKK